MVKNSFAFRGVDTWNKLHSDIKLAPSIQLFKGQIKAKYFFIDFYHLQPGDFKISNEISI